MATETILYGAEAAFGSASNITSLASAAGKPLGVVDNSTALAVDYKYKVKATLNSAGVSATGTLEVWLLESNDNTDWTDNLNPAGTTDIAASLKCAKLLQVVPATAVSQVVVVEGDLTGAPAVANCPRYFTLVVVNKSGAALAATGGAATYMSVKYTVA